MAGNLSDWFVNATEFKSEILADESAWVANTTSKTMEENPVIEFAQDSLVDMLGDVFSSLALVKDDNDKVYLNQLVQYRK